MLAPEKEIHYQPSVSPTLQDVPVGASAEVVSVDCDRRLARRLFEMGLLPGTRVRVVRVAPLGDPIELHLRDYALSVRSSEASRITVRVEEAS